MSLDAKHDRTTRQTISSGVSQESSSSSKRSSSGAIAIQCQFCPCQRFRRSRLRSKDLTDLFLMRYPVRCLRCGQRQAVSYTVAAVSVPSHVRHKQASNDHKSQMRRVAGSGSS